MAKRRQAVSAQQVKKRNTAKIKNKIFTVVNVLWKPRIIAACLLLVMLCVAYDSMDMQQMLPVESVQIEGEFKYLDKQKLREQAIPVVNGSFFSVDLVAVRNALIDLPWVEDVSVRRQWPDRLLVRVIEKQPVVFWGEDALLSAKGKLFVPGKKLDINLPQLTGPEGQHQTMLKELARMQAWLLETGLYIQDMQLDARRSWTLKMTTGMEIRLGRKQLHERLHRFVSVFKSDLQSEKREIKHIDMRYTNGFAVAWKEA